MGALELRYNEEKMVECINNKALNTITLIQLLCAPTKQKKY